MRILIGVHQFFPKHYTGTERYVLNLAKHLQKLGHYVKVLTYAFREADEALAGRTSKMLFKEFSYEGVPVISLRHRRHPDDLSFVFDFIDMDMYRMVKDILERDKFDIYHCAHPLRIASSIKAARDAGVKVCFMVTDYFMMCPQGILLRSDNTLCDGPDEGRNCLKYCFTAVSKDRMKQRISDAHALLDCCDRLLSPSRFLINAFHQVGFIDEGRFVLSRHGFDYSKRKSYSLRKIRDVITFGYIGTVQYHKGVHIMVEGFRSTSGPNVRLKVWGGCMHEVAYQKKVVRLAEGDQRIEFEGQYDYNRIGEILEGIDVVIVPSIWYENAPLTIMTGLAYGIPVVVSDIGGMREAIREGRNGLTFRVGDPDDLSRRISSIAGNPGILEEFKKTLQYPIRAEEEAFNTELVYKGLFP